MPWQQQVVDVALEVEPDGSWSYRTVIVTVQRQAGKTTLLGPVNLHRALSQAQPCYFTAQSRQDARDTWLDVVTRLRKSPLAPAAKIRESNGSEAVTFATGGRFSIFAPSEDALHGKANALVTVDESWSFDAARGIALEQAILPTFTTTGGQLWLPSTAGHSGSVWLRGFVEKGRAAVEADHREQIAYFEWSLDDEQASEVAAGLADDATPDARTGALELLLSRHAAYGFRRRDGKPQIDRGALEQAAATQTPDQFLRAYGNVWTAAVDRVIPEHVWLAAQRDLWTPPEPGSVALAFDADVNRTDAAIAAAWRDSPTGPLRFDVIDHHPGTAWLVPRLRELIDRWRPVGVGWPGSGPAIDLADELTRGGLTLQPTSTRDYTAACAAFLAAVKDRRGEHPGRPSLDDAVAAAATRPLGDAWAWSRRSSAASIAPLTAATVAGWTFDHRPPPAARPVIVSSRRRHLAA